MNYKYLIWDWNGTLFNDAWLCQKIINKMLEKRKLAQISIADYQEKFSFPVINFYQELGFDFSTETFADLGQEYISLYEENKQSCKLQPGAIKALRIIKEKGIKQAVLSAYKQSTLLDIISSFKLTSYFEEIFGLDNIYAHGKIDLGHKLKAQLKKTDFPAVLVGDTVHDLEVASALKIDCILISHGHYSHLRLKKSGAQVLKNFPEFFLKFK